MGFRLSVNNKSGREGSVDNRTRGHAKTLVVFWLQSLLGVALVTFLGGAALVYAWTANEKADALDQLQGWGAVVVRDIEKIETAVEPKFQEHFVEAMAIPHKTAPYPHLKTVVDLPEPKIAALDEANGDGGRRRRRRERHAG